MFSEYASRFLAQSQSRPSIRPGDSDNSPQKDADGRRLLPARTSRRGSIQPEASSSDAGRQQKTSRSFFAKPAMPTLYNPGAGSQFNRFPFASRLSTAAAAAPAPLFVSATDQFRDEDDGEEHEREIADLYALQASRRQFGNSRLQDSSDIDGDWSEETLRRQRHRGRDYRNAARDDVIGRGIRSSWKGDEPAFSLSPAARSPALASVAPRNVAASVASSRSKGKGNMVDVELSSTSRESSEDSEAPGSPSEGFSIEHPPRQSSGAKAAPSSDTTPRASQHVGSSKPGRPIGSGLPRRSALGQDHEDWDEDESEDDDEDGAIPSELVDQPPDYPRHDPFWSSLFFICFASMFATYVLVYLHTSAPDKKHPLGDTIYTLLQSSGHLLGVYTLVSAVVALAWFAALRYFIRPLALLVVVAVPIILFSFSLYPLVASFSGSWHGNSAQDRAMRALSLIPGILAVLWAYTVYRGRHSFNKGLEILAFAGRILAANSPLVYVALVDMALVILWTFLWKAMFARVFLGGHLSKSKSLFVIDGSSWWLGIYFVLVYLWTLGIVSGVQRAATAATVSNWYFHRLAVPAPGAGAVVQASLAHATGAMFGSICLSSLLSLAVRLPLLVLPRRLAGLVSLAAYAVTPTPVAALTNPLALTYAATHSLPLVRAARALATLSFVSPTYPTTTLSPHNFFNPGAGVVSRRDRRNSSGGGGGGGVSVSASARPTLLPYRLAKLLLHATRLVMAVALGFGGWVATARSSNKAGAGLRGSLYAYLVGLLAAAIGWAVLGATEGLLGGIVDALVICWASEVGGKLGDYQAGEARYCREAGELFAEEEVRGDV